MGTAALIACGEPVLAHRGEAGGDSWKELKAGTDEGRGAVEQAVAADNPAAAISCRIETPTRRRSCS